MRHDLGDVLRRLRHKRPRVIAAVLALGVGASAAGRRGAAASAPFADPERLMRVYESNAASGQSEDGPSPLNQVDWTRSARGCSHLYPMRALIGMAYSWTHRGRPRWAVRSRPR
jgi:hypothetical protein